MLTHSTTLSLTAAPRPAVAQPTTKHCPDMALAESATCIVYAATVAFASLLLAAEPPVVIMDDGKLRLICLAGAIGGALLSVIMFPPSRNVRGLAAKFTGSGIAGVMFAPWCVQYANIGNNTDAVLAVSGLVGLAAWTTLQILVPKLSNLAATKITGRIERPDDDQSTR